MNPFIHATNEHLEETLLRSDPNSQNWHGVTAEIQRRLLSGDATWEALKSAVNELVSSAPQDHDVILQICDLSVTESRFIKPHTFFFEGFDQDGHRAGAVVHFSQVKALVVYLPKRGPERIITGFAS